MTITATQTRFCHQTWQLDAQIQLVQNHNEVTYVVTDVTPFHPVSHIWPDHPADKGILVFNDQQFELIVKLVPLKWQPESYLLERQSL